MLSTIGIFLLAKNSAKDSATQTSTANVDIVQRVSPLKLVVRSRPEETNGLPKILENVFIASSAQPVEPKAPRITTPPIAAKGSEPRPVVAVNPSDTAPPSASASTSPKPVTPVLESVRKKVKLPWFAGSEYRCKICNLLFFYNQVSDCGDPLAAFESF